MCGVSVSAMIWRSTEPLNLSKIWNLPCDTRVAILRVTSLLLINKMTLKVIEANEGVSRLSNTESDNYQLNFVPACQVTPWLNGYRTPNSHVSDPSSDQSRWDNWCFLLLLLLFVCLFVSSSCCSINIRQWRETLKSEALGGFLPLSLSLPVPSFGRALQKRICSLQQNQVGLFMWQSWPKREYCQYVYNFSDEIIN